MYGILSPLCLPISPPGQLAYYQHFRLNISLNAYASTNKVQRVYNDFNLALNAD